MGNPCGMNSCYSPSDTDEDQRQNDQICILQRNKRQPLVVSFQSIDAGLPKSWPGFILDALSCQYLDCNRSTEPNLKRQNKLIMKSQGALQRLIDFINNTTQKEFPFSNDLSHSVGNRAVMSQPQAQDGKTWGTCEVFSELRLSFGDGYTSRQFYHCRASAIKPEWLQKHSSHRTTSIHINSGLCLFSKAAIDLARDRIQKGELPLLSEAKSTLYEVEIIARLASTIADWVTIIQGGKGSDTFQRCPLSINIDVPDFQYYWFACELLESNAVSIAHVEAWISLVDQRRDQLGEIILSAVHQLLEERRIHSPATGEYIKLQLTSGTESAAVAIKDAISTGRIPTVGNILSALQDDCPDAVLWKEFLVNLEPEHYPETMSELGRVSYIYKAVKPALVQKLANNDSGGLTVILQVDDLTEWKIYEQAKRFLKKYGANGQPNETCIFGVFPLQKVFVTGNGRSCLYVNDPGPDLYQDIANNNNLQSVSPLEIIKKCYGSRVGEVVEGFFREQDLL